MCRMCYGGVIKATFYDLKTGEEVASFDNVKTNINELDSINLNMIDNIIVNPNPIYGKYLDLREDYSNEHIVAQIELGKFKAKNTIDAEDWIESFDRMRNGVTIGKQYYDERSVDNWKSNINKRI